MRYRNIKTGIEFTSTSKISGADIEEVKPNVYEPKPEPKAEPAKEVKTPKKTVLKRSKK